MVDVSPLEGVAVAVSQCRIPLSPAPRGLEVKSRAQVPRGPLSMFVDGCRLQLAISRRRESMQCAACLQARETLATASTVCWV